MNTALAFSGGKDSWACLWLNKDRLSEVLVIWVNTGKNYPEILETIAKAKAICPNFVEIVVDRDKQNALEGLPSDVVPINWTSLGQLVTGEKPVKVQSYISCCYHNIGEHLQAYCKTFGITRLIRGQRNDEGYKSTARNGSVIDGVRYEQPIEDWTEEKVLSYVAENMLLPDHFQFKHSSMDCYDCTAFSSESKDRIEYTKAYHPIIFSAYESRKKQLNEALAQAMSEFHSEI